MGLLSPPNNFDHLLVVISGSDGMHDLQFTASPDAAADFRRGSLVSVSAAGTIVAGLDVPHAMPLWAINDSKDFDVASDIGNISGGVAATFPATGGYELVTTEFDKAATYVPNAPLIAGTVAGEVTVGTIPLAPLENVIGVVSKGVRTEVYNQTVLQFWPVYLPAK